VARRRQGPRARRYGAVPVMRMILLAGCAVVGIATLAACDPVGPNYARPTADIPEAFVEAGPWKQAVPQDTIARGDWWTIFGDPVLNGLQVETVRQSPDLKAAAARVLQAQAVAGISRSYLYPEVNAGALGQRFANNSNFAGLV